MEQMSMYLTELEQYLHQLSEILPPSNDAFPLIPLEQMRELCLKKYTEISQSKDEDQLLMDEKQK